SPYDVLTMGRIAIDLYPLQGGVGLDEVETFKRYLGGSATDVAVAASRHGLNASVITGVGADPFGQFCTAEAARLGVDTSHIFIDDTNPTPVTFCEIHPPDHFPIYFYRFPKAPDLNIEDRHLDLDAVRSSRVFCLTVTGLSEEPSRGSHFTAVKARGRNTNTILDLDDRPVFWHPTTHARLERGVQIAIVKQGPDGVLAKTADETVVVPPHFVEVVNGLGAGDGFGGALTLGLLRGWGLEETLRFANVAGAIVASRHE